MQPLPPWWGIFWLYITGGLVVTLAIAGTICCYPYSRSGLDRAQGREVAEGDGYSTLSLPRMGEQQWLAVRPTLLAFPNVCARCGNEPTGDVKVPLGRLVRLSIPVCSHCRWKCYRGRLWRALSPALVMLIGSAAIILLTVHDGSAFEMIAMMSAVCAVLGLLVTPLLWLRWTVRGGMPIEMRNFREWSDDAQIRFRSAEVAKLFIEDCLRRSVAAQRRP